MKTPQCGVTFFPVISSFLIFNKSRKINGQAFPVTFALSFTIAIITSNAQATGLHTLPRTQKRLMFMLDFHIESNILSELDINVAAILKSACFSALTDSVPHKPCRKQPPVTRRGLDH